MAVLEEAERATTWAALMTTLSGNREQLALSKSDLRAALDATDTWINSNKVAFNSALPVAAQAGMTAPQKARLFMLVAERRFLGGV